MYNIYVPFDDLSLFSSYYFNDDMSLIYATNDDINFTIIDLKNHYQLVDSSTLDISSYELIEIDKNNLTNNWTYRSDLDSILICFMYFILFFVGIPLFLLSRFFKKRW